MKAKRIAIGAATLLVGYFGLEWYHLSGRSISVPPERDPSLVGTWNGRRSPEAEEESVRFFPDGTARATHWGPIQWGTMNGELHLKFRSSGEGWNHCQAIYTIDAQARTLSVQGKPWIPFPKRTKRTDRG